MSHRRIAVAVMLLAVACGEPATPIGGGWYAGNRATMSMDDRGAKGMLYRRVRGKRVAVGRDVYEYRFYPPDCVVWQTGQTVFGACGTRRPVPVTVSNSLDWAFRDDRIDYLGAFSIIGGRKPPERPQFILVDSVRAVAARQPSLGWTYRAVRDGGLDFDPSLEPTIGAAVGIDVATRDNLGETMLFEAVRQQYRERIPELLAAGADPNARNNAGMTPLMFAVTFTHGADTAIVGQLLAAGANVNARDDKGWTPLIYAVRDGPSRVIIQLLGAGADVRASDLEGKFVRDHAAFRLDPGVVALVADAQRRAAGVAR